LLQSLNVALERVNKLFLQNSAKLLKGGPSRHL